MKIKEMLNFVTEATGMEISTQFKIIDSLMIVCLIWLVKTLILRIVFRRTDDVRIRYSWRKTTNYIAVTSALLLIGRVWFEAMGSFSTFLGLLSAGVAIALRDLIASVAGWVFVILRRPFEVGDRIQISSFKGDVIDIRLFQFTLMEIGNWIDAEQSTGRIVHVPNSLVLSQALANYSKGFQYIWNEIPVLITFESDWKKAKEILTEIAYEQASDLNVDAREKVEEATKKFMIFYKNLTPTVYTSVKDSGVLLTIRYLCMPRQRRGTEQQIWEKILSQFAASDRIEFAYPTRRFVTEKE